MPGSAPTQPPLVRWTDYLGLALASAAVLALQVTATRLFSFLIWYHFAFLVLSIAFLGFTAGGLLVGTGGRLSRIDPPRLLCWLGLAGGLSAIAAFFALARLPIEPYVFASARAVVMLLAVVVVTLVPFVCLGAYICLALARGSEQIDTLYAVNLVGSAAGCAIVVWLLDWLGVPAAFFASGLFAFGSGLCVLGGSWRRPVPAIIAAVGVTGFLLLVWSATDQLRPWVYIKSAKAYPHVPRELVAERRSDSLSSVDVFAMRDTRMTLWGISPKYRSRPLPRAIGFAIDGWALTSVLKRSDVEVPDSALTYLPASTPYRIHPAKDALVIGAGGGIDILSALYHGVEHVVGVEINPIIFDSVKRTYKDFAGDLYDDPRVEMHVAEGRHFLKRDRREYDIIQLSGVDTFAASQAGAFALHENYLYTVEAMQDYLQALKPHGMLTFTRWLYVPERQTIRLAAIADRVLRARGAERPQNHLAIVASDQFSVVMIKQDEFTPDESEQLSRDAAARSFDLIYAPHVRVNPRRAVWGENPFYALWDEGPENFIARYPLDIRPTTDDRPFFFEYQRWGQPLARDVVFINQNAQIVLLETLVVCALLCAVMLALAHRRYRAVPARLGAAAHVYFAVLGLGYIFVENVLVQRIILFLGSPSYALTVILFTLLAASGLGSGFATRVPALRDRAPFAMLAAAALLLLYSFALRPILDALLGLDLAWRVAIVIVLISPLGVLLGMPFPLAIAKVTRSDPRLLPWAWVINGAASALGSVITVMIAMNSGFSAVFWAAAALYVCAALTYPRLIAVR